MVCCKLYFQPIRCRGLYGRRDIARLQKAPLGQAHQVAETVLKHVGRFLRMALGGFFAHCSVAICTPDEGAAGTGRW